MDTQHRPGNGMTNLKMNGLFFYKAERALNSKMAT